MTHNQRMDLTAQWHQFVLERGAVTDLQEEQDSLQADAVRKMNEAADALQAYHDHQRDHGRKVTMPMHTLAHLLFWAEVVISYSE